MPPFSQQISHISLVGIGAGHGVLEPLEAAQDRLIGVRNGPRMAHEAMADRFAVRFEGKFSGVARPRCMGPLRRAIEDQQRADADSAALGRLALSKCEAAEALGVSVDFLERHVMDDLRVVRRGRRRLIPVRELERWLEENALRALDTDRRPG